MIKLSKKVEYALVALLHLDLQPLDEHVSTHEISEMYQLPEEALGKVLQKLVKGALLKSVQGAKGGYRLARRLDDVRLGDVMEVLEGPVGTSHHGDDHTLCLEFCTCYVRGAVEEVHKNILEHMNSVSLADILKSKMLARSVAGLKEVS